MKKADVKLCTLIALRSIFIRNYGIPNRGTKQRNAPRRLAKQNANGNSQGDFKIGPYPLACPQNSETRTEHEPLVDHSPDTPDLTQQPIETRISERNVPSYQHPNTPPLGVNSRLPGHNPRSLGCLRRLSQDAENM